MIAKPICVIYFPDAYISGSSKKLWIYEYARFLNGETKDDDKWTRSDYFKDYYWFCFYGYDIAAPEFKVFHEKDFTEIQYAELKKIVEDSLKKGKIAP